MTGIEGHFRLAFWALSAGIAMMCASGALAASNPLPKLLGAAGASLCFQRTYDQAHLRSHPGQRTTSALLSIHPGKDKSGQSVWFKMLLQQTGRAAPAPVGASCAWSETANTDTSGNRLIPSYNGSAGFVCIAMYDNQSAEEAGSLIFDLAPDGNSVMAYFDSDIGLWGSDPERFVQDPKTGKWKTDPGPAPLPLGREDRVFRLTRADPGECRPLDQTIRIDE
jgi:hypothetical protein